ncbi:MAG: hypothetical protein MMC33_008237 [Icmadophila ericetorum]|nr:hypothetical protein [Icmadophila ericetorum]
MEMVKNEAYDALYDDVEKEEKDEDQRYVSLAHRDRVIVSMAATIFLLLCAVLGQGIYYSERHASTPPPAIAEVPEYFQLTTELFQGPTATGSAPFLAETNPAPLGTGTFVPNQPLETNIPITGNDNNTNIFTLMGQLSPYQPSPGWGVDELPLPPGANITQLHMLSRHGSRYPSSFSPQEAAGDAIASAKKSGATFTSDLEFLNTWSYGLGYEILVPNGRKELFDSGVLHYYQYAALYNPNTTVVARTTTQDRMLKSAENFLTGFFDLPWQTYGNIKLEHIIEAQNFNNSLAGYHQCPNFGNPHGVDGSAAAQQWSTIYLQNTTARLNSMSTGFIWTPAVINTAQALCPYETVAFGFSEWCSVFTFEEWQGYEYSVDLDFAGDMMFQSPLGRAIGIGYVQEILARLEGHLMTTPDTQDNVTLDSMPETFPLNQTLYFDFSHDANIASILTAFGFRQFSQFLPTTGPPLDQQMIVSHVVPFGARLDIEIIYAPEPVSPTRTAARKPNDAYLQRDQRDRRYQKDQAIVGVEPTKYIHFILNQRTLPLGQSFPECGDRTDGWCELDTFIDLQQDSSGLAQYEYACFGDYPVVPYGNITNGAPQAV